MQVIAMMRKQSKMYAAGGKVKTKTHPDGYKYKKAESWKWLRRTARWFLFMPLTAKAR